MYGLNWPNTNTGEVAVVRCPLSCDAKKKSATRLCNSNNIWGIIDTSNCDDEYSCILLGVNI